jgi:multidrug resistance efflux pump
MDFGSMQMSSKKRHIIARVVLICVAVLSYFLVQRYWYQPTHNSVYTDNARIDGTRADVVAESQGQVVQLPYDTGDKVEKLHSVATLKITVPASTLSSDNPHYIYQNILAPLSGVVVSRWIDLGDTASPGQRLLTIIDPDDIWVIANIDENEIHRIKLGQRVDIHVDATDETLPGSVEYIIPLTTSMIQQPAGSSVIVAADTQDVPVRISLEQKSNYPLYPGLSTEVTIYTNE